MCKSQAHLHEHVEADVFETHVHKLIREVPPNLLKGIFLIIIIIVVIIIIIVSTSSRLSGL